MKRLIFPNVSLYRNTLIPRMIFWQGKTEETQNTLVWPGMVANSNASFRQWTTNWKSDVKHFGKIWWVTGWLLRVHSRTWLMTSHFSVIVLDEGQLRVTESKIAVHCKRRSNHESLRMWDLRNPFTGKTHTVWC